MPEIEYFISSSCFENNNKLQRDTLNRWQQI